MSSLILTGDTSGTITLAAPAVAGTHTLTMPVATGTAVLEDASGVLQMNSGYGSNAAAYGCRAWVNFNGSGTVAIRDSANVSSITDNGVGDYTVNFTTAMVDANYSVVGSGQGNGDFNRGAGLILDLPKLGTTPTTSAIRFRAAIGSSINAFGGLAYDSVYIYLSVLR